MTARVHITERPPKDLRKARARCGHWVTCWTTHPEAATCKGCIRRPPLTASRPQPKEEETRAA